MLVELLAPNRAPGTGPTGSDTQTSHPTSVTTGGVTFNFPSSNSSSNNNGSNSNSHSNNIDPKILELFQDYSTNDTTKAKLDSLSKLLSQLGVKEVTISEDGKIKAVSVKNVLACHNLGDKQLKDILNALQDPTFESFFSDIIKNIGNNNNQIKNENLVDNTFNFVSSYMSNDMNELKIKILQIMIETRSEVIKAIIEHIEKRRELDKEFNEDMNKKKHEEIIEAKALLNALMNKIISLPKGEDRNKLLSIAVTIMQNATTSIPSGNRFTFTNNTNIDEINEILKKISTETDITKIHEMLDDLITKLEENDNDSTDTKTTNNPSSNRENRLAFCEQYWCLHQSLSFA
jgi:hypothetical protein